MEMINVSEITFISIGGKRRRMERASRLAEKLSELGKRKRINNDVNYSKKMRLETIVEEVEEVAKKLSELIL